MCAVFVSLLTSSVLRAVIQVCGGFRSLSSPYKARANSKEILQRTTRSKLISVRARAYSGQCLLRLRPVGSRVSLHGSTKPSESYCKDCPHQSSTQSNCRPVAPAPLPAPGCNCHSEARRSAILPMNTLPVLPILIACSEVRKHWIAEFD